MHDLNYLIDYGSLKNILLDSFVLFSTVFVLQYSVITVYYNYEHNDKLHTLRSLISKQ